MVLLKIIFLLSSSFASAQAIYSLKLQTTKDLIATEIIDLNFYIQDSQKQVIKNFELNHEKYNHAIIVSSDLNSFAHVHPQLQKDGIFRILLNEDISFYDIDNTHAAQAIQQPGEHFIYSEFVPQGQKKPITLSATLPVSGESPQNPIVLDSITSSGWIVKYFNADASVGTDGAYYKVSLMTHPMTGMVHLMLRVEEAMNHGGVIHYMPASPLENWLGMQGHGILISASGSTHESKIFKHMHVAGSHNHSGHKTAVASGDKLEFVLMGADVPPPGIYKLWTQIKHKGIVLTFPFVIQL